MCSVELALHVNGQMPHYVVDKIQSALNDVSKPVKGSHIHVMGVAYKKDIDDMRESPAIDVVHLLRERGAKITYSDPYVPVFRVDKEEFFAQDPIQCAAQADCVVIITNHTNSPYSSVIEKASLIVDTRNALKGYKSNKIVRL
ncbi:MAG: UDP binding domain-containing protein [Bryobacteraceae bacterium]